MIKGGMDPRQVTIVGFETKCDGILKELQAMAGAPFIDVDAGFSSIEGYSKIIPYPMSIESVRNRLYGKGSGKQKKYTYLNDFALDVRRICGNFFRYNYTNDALKYRRDIRKLYIKFEKKWLDLQKDICKTTPGMVFVQPLLEAIHCLCAIDECCKLTSSLSAIAGSNTKVFAIDGFFPPIEITMLPETLKGYLKIVKTPMTFAIIVSKIVEGGYDTLDQVKDDVALIVDNCSTYWSLPDNAGGEGEMYIQDARSLQATFANALATSLAANKAAKSNRSDGNAPVMLERLDTQSLPQSVPSTITTSAAAEFKKKSSEVAASVAAAAVSVVAAAAAPVLSQAAAERKADRVVRGLVRFCLQRVKEHYIVVVSAPVGAGGGGAAATATTTTHRVHTSFPFEKAVNPVQFPDYALIVTRPMDIARMEKKLAGDRYAVSGGGLAAVLQDMDLLVSNAHLYNTGIEGMEVCIMADTMAEYFRYLLTLQLRLLKTEGDPVVCRLVLTEAVQAALFPAPPTTEPLLPLAAPGAVKRDRSGNAKGKAQQQQQQQQQKSELAVGAEAAAATITVTVPERVQKFLEVSALDPAVALVDRVSVLQQLDMVPTTTQPVVAVSDTSVSAAKKPPPPHGAAKSSAKPSGGISSSGGGGASASSSSAANYRIAYLDEIAPPPAAAAVDSKPSKKRVSDSFASAPTTAKSKSKSNFVDIAPGDNEWDGAAAVAAEQQLQSPPSKKRAAGSTAAAAAATATSSVVATALSAMPLLPLRTLLPWEVEADGVLKTLSRHPYVDPSKQATVVANFYIPIDSTNLSEDFKQLVNKRPPMDLSTLGYNLDAGVIKDPDEFTAALLSVFQNAADFNEPNKSTEWGAKLATRYAHLERYCTWLCQEAFVGLESATNATISAAAEADSAGAVVPSEGAAMRHVSAVLQVESRDTERAFRETLLMRTPVDAVGANPHAECKRLIKNLERCKSNADRIQLNFFMVPVDEKVLTDYAVFVRSPIDISSIKYKLDGTLPGVGRIASMITASTQPDSYPTVGAPIADLRSVFSNALKYNRAHLQSDTTGISQAIVAAAEVLSRRLEQQLLGPFTVAVADRVLRVKIVTDEEAARVAVQKAKRIAEMRAANEFEMRELAKLKASDAALAADLDLQTKQRSTEQQLRAREEAAQRLAADRLRSLGAVTAGDEELFSDLLADAAATAKRRGSTAGGAGALSPEQGGAALSPTSGSDNGNMSGGGGGNLYALGDGVVLGSDGEPLSAAALLAQRKLAGLVAPAAVPGFGVAGALAPRHWGQALLKLRAARRARIYWKANMQPPQPLATQPPPSSSHGAGAVAAKPANVSLTTATVRCVGAVFEPVSAADVDSIAEERRPRVVARLNPPPNTAVPARRHVIGVPGAFGEADSPCGF